jgi:outer membrane receptor protein involved in Fe transport
VTSNWNYAKYFSRSPKVVDNIPPGLECSDTLINLEEMRRQGVEFEIDGHIFDNLSFYANYAYTELKSLGGEPAGEEAEAERARHRVNAGLRYNPLTNTLLMLDYKYQDKQISQNSEEVAEDEYIWYTVEMDAYHVFDFAIEQTLFRKYGFFEDAAIKFYINNLFDEEYQNTRGYPMTDRTYGAAVSLKF